MKSTKLPIPFLFSLLLLAPMIATADEEGGSASDVKPKPTTITGVFESIAAKELSADTEQVKSLKIKKIVPHGSVVTKDQNLVWFETEDVDKQIKAAQTALQLAELTYRDEEFAYEQFLESQKLDRAAAERNYQKAKQDYDNFVQVDRERQIASAHFSLKSSNASLANVMEELKQLEQMYKEDDLTEESEEIVLKRAKQSVESAQFRLEGTEISTERALKQTIPRSQSEQKDAITRAEMAHDKAIRELNTARRRRDIERTQKKDKFAEEQKKFNELQEERKSLIIQAPFAGLVFHGKLTRGKVSDKPSGLVAGGTVTSEQVLVTLAQTGKLQIRVDLLEKDLPVVTVGAKGKLKVAAAPKLETTVTVKSVSKVPYAGTKFDCVLSVKIPKGESQIVPGMTCSIEFAAEETE